MEDLMWIKKRDMEHDRIKYWTHWLFNSIWQSKWTQFCIQHICYLSIPRNIPQL
jgi:hypothetical protein